MVVVVVVLAVVLVVTCGPSCKVFTGEITVVELLRVLSSGMETARRRRAPWSPFVFFLTTNAKECLGRTCPGWMRGLSSSALLTQYFSQDGHLPKTL